MENDGLFKVYEDIPISVYHTVIDEYLPGRRAPCRSSDYGEDHMYGRFRLDGCRVHLGIKKNSRDVGTLCMIVEDGPQDRKEEVFNELDSIILNIAGRK